MTQEITKGRLIQKREKETVKESANGSTDLTTKVSGKMAIGMAKEHLHLEKRLFTKENGITISGMDLVRLLTKQETRSEEPGRMIDSMEKERFKMLENAHKNVFSKWTWP